MSFDPTYHFLSFLFPFGERRLPLAHAGSWARPALGVRNGEETTTIRSGQAAPRATVRTFHNGRLVKESCEGTTMRATRELSWRSDGSLMLSEDYDQLERKRSSSHQEHADGMIAPSSVKLINGDIAANRKWSGLRYCWDRSGRLVSVFFEERYRCFDLAWKGDLLVSCTGPGFKASFGYDAKGLLTNETRIISEEFAERYGRLLHPSISMPRKSARSYSWDQSGRPTAVVGEKPDFHMSLRYGAYGSLVALLMAEGPEDWKSYRIVSLGETEAFNEIQPLDASRVEDSHRAKLVVAHGKLAMLKEAVENADGEPKDLEYRALRDLRGTTWLWASRRDNRGALCSEAVAKKSNGSGKYALTWSIERAIESTASLSMGIKFAWFPSSNL